MEEPNPPSRSSSPSESEDEKIPPASPDPVLRPPEPVLKTYHMESQMQKVSDAAFMRVMQQEARIGSAKRKRPAPSTTGSGQTPPTASIGNISNPWKSQPRYPANPKPQLSHSSLHLPADPVPSGSKPPVFGTLNLLTSRPQLPLPSHSSHKSAMSHNYLQGHIPQPGIMARHLIRHQGPRMQAPSRHAVNYAPRSYPMDMTHKHKAQMTRPEFARPRVPQGRNPSESTEPFVNLTTLAIASELQKLRENVDYKGTSDTHTHTHNTALGKRHMRTPAGTSSSKGHKRTSKLPAINHSQGYAPVKDQAKEEEMFSPTHTFITTMPGAFGMRQPETSTATTSFLTSTVPTVVFKYSKNMPPPPTPATKANKLESGKDSASGGKNDGTTPGKESKVQELLNKVKAKQKALLERTAELTQRARIVQAREMGVHATQELCRYVQHAQKELNVPQEGYVPPHMAMLNAEDAKGLSTSALISLVRRMAKPGPRRPHSLPKYFPSEDPSPSFRPMAKLTQEVNADVEKVAGQMASQLHKVQEALDSDATWSSSGSESGDEADREAKASMVPAWFTNPKMAYIVPERKPTYSEIDLLRDHISSNPNLHKVDPPPAPKSLRKRYRKPAWQWLRGRSQVGARWGWLQACVSDLEYKIRQHNELHKQLRVYKGPVQLATSQDHTGSSQSKSKMRHFILPDGTLIGCNDLQSVIRFINSKRLNSSPIGADHTDQSATDTSSESSSDEETRKVGSCSRTRPLINFRRRKTITITGTQYQCNPSCKAITVKCSCTPPVTSCILCLGVRCRTVPVDADCMPVAERAALLDSGLHAVLSLPENISTSPHLDAILKVEEWMQLQSLPRKPLRSSTKHTKSHHSKRMVEDVEQKRKYSSQLKKVALSSKLRNLKASKKGHDMFQIQAKKKNLQRLKRKRQAAKIAIAALHRVKVEEALIDQEIRVNEDSRDSADMDPDCISTKSSPASSPGTDKSDGIFHHHRREREKMSMLQELLKRKRESSYDIDNIVIPYSIAASTRVEKLQYKEILTPKWRLIEEESSKQELRASKLESLKPESLKPESLKPESLKPESSKPESSKPESSKPESAKPECAKPESAKPESAKPESAKPESAKPESAKPESTKPESAKPESAKPESAKPETAKPESAKPESAKPELAKLDLAKLEPTDATSGTKEDDVEDISDEAYANRHDRCEIEEKKKFSGFITQQSGRNRARRADSRAESSGGNTPDPLSPLMPDIHMDMSPLTTPPGTPLPLIDDNTQLGALVRERRRTTSFTRHRDEYTDTMDEVGSQSSYASLDMRPGIPPYEPRSFPLGDSMYEQMAMEMPPNHPFPSSPSSRKSGRDSIDQMEVCGPLSPHSDSTESAVEDDPDDPEWTMKDKDERARPGLVPKVAKR